MAQEDPGSNVIKDVIIMFVIWGLFLAMIMSNARMRNYIFSLVGLTGKTAAYNDVVFLRQNNVFRGASLYADKRPNVYDIVLSPWSADMFFAGTDAGIYVSGDRGESWRRLDALSREIGEDVESLKFFTDLRNPSQLSFLVLRGGKAVVYHSNDNLNSVFKDYEIDAEAMKKIFPGRVVSSEASADGIDIIGTRK